MIITVEDIMAQLQTMGDEKVKKIWLKHGIKEPFFGVKIENLKQLQKKIKINYQLAKELYATGNADAMYLAGLVTDDNKMTKDDLIEWVRQAESSNINEYIIPWVASQGKFGYELALKWIENALPHIAAAGWATLSCHVSLTDDDKLDITVLKKLLDRVEDTIHETDDQVRLKMNGFVIALGSYVVPLHNNAIASAMRIGLLKANMYGTACKMPDAATYIAKVKDKGKLGIKKKEVKC